MPNKRIPWFKCWGGMTVDPKVAPLSDAVFRTWVELLDAASQQPVRGRFKDAKSAAAIVRRPVAHVTSLVKEQLIDETPDGLTMHNWDQWQRWRQEDADDPGSPPDIPPDEHRINSRSTPETPLEFPPDQPANGLVIDTSPLRAQRAKKREERRETLDVRDKTGDVTPPATTSLPPRGAAAPTFTNEEQSQINSVARVLTPFAISTDPQLWRKVLDTYGAVDLEAEALKQADWMRRHKIKACSSARYLNWLDKARAQRIETGDDAVCTCSEIRRNLAINRNSSRMCAEHGRVQDFAVVVPPSERSRPPSAA